MARPASRLEPRRSQVSSLAPHPPPSARRSRRRTGLRHIPPVRRSSRLSRSRSRSSGTSCSAHVRCLRARSPREARGPAHTLPGPSRWAPQLLRATSRHGCCTPRSRPSRVAASRQLHSLGSARARPACAGRSWRSDRPALLSKPPSLCRRQLAPPEPGDLRPRFCGAGEWIHMASRNQRGQ
eukprot:COSAG05_NODE_229_length_13378_cov_4.728594_3_plen_182_part_00